MKKSIGRRLLATLLSVSIVFSMSVISFLPASSATARSEVGGVKAFVVDKMVEIGLRVACEGVVAVSEASAEKGYDNVSKAAALIAEWGLMSAEEAATTKNIELCEEILSELQRLSEITTKGIANINTALSELKAELSTQSLVDQQKDDINNVISPINETGGVLESYRNYVDVAAQYKDGSVAEEDLQQAQYDFLYALRSYAGITDALSGKSLEDLSKQVFGSTANADKVNQGIEGILGTLSKNLIIESGTHSANVMSEAMKFASIYYPFSHQQYDFVTEQVGVQIHTIVEVMTMYNEILALQYGYLTNTDTLTESELDSLLTTYGTHVKKFNETLIPGVMNNIDYMLSAEYSVGTGVTMSIDDYMKPEDAVLTTLKINNYSSNDNIDAYNNYYKLMTHNKSGEDNILYLWNGSSFASRNYSSSNKGVTNTYKSLVSDISDGCNTFSMPSATEVDDGGVFGDPVYEVGAYNKIFNSDAFALHGNTINNYFHDYNDNGKYNLISAPYLFTPEYSTSKLDTEADFYLIDVNNTETDPASIKTTTYAYGGNAKLTAMYTSDSTYSQKLALETVGVAGSEMTVTAKNSENNSGSDVTLSSGNSSVIPSGNTLTIQVKVPKNTDFTLKCIRDYNTYGSELSSTSEMVLLNDEIVEGTYDSDDGTYYYRTLKYTMPYSDTKLVLDVNEFESDDEGNILISSYEDLKKMAEHVNSSPTSYASKSYLVVNSFTVPDNSELIPIGTSSAPFTGTFDGQNYTITNLNFKSDHASAGLFGYSKGTIKNVVLDGASIYGTEYAGGICGTCSGGAISNCVVKNSDLSDGYFSCGGIAGYLSDARIEKCANIGSTVSSSFEGGGIVGMVWCEYDYPIVSDCYNAGTVNGECSGGIAGTMWFGSNMYNCYNAGTVNGTETAGGIVGQVNDMLAPLTVDNCYYDSNIFGGNAVGSFLAGQTDTSDVLPKTTDQFKSGEVAYLLNSGKTDGTQIWYQNIDNRYAPDTYPAFANNGKNTVYKVDLSNKTYSNFEDGVVDIFDTDENGNFIIRTYGDLCNVAVMVNSGDEKYIKGSYIVANDITCSSGENWSEPIGTKDNPFMGEFDGNGYTISELKSTTVNGKSCGLFGAIESGTVKNLNLVNVDFKLYDYVDGTIDSYIGVICGYMSSGSLITNCEVSGTLNTLDLNALGGICGYSKDSTIEKCINKASIDSSAIYAGGICGMNKGIIDSCANQGSIKYSGVLACGGIAGGDSTSANVIKNCYNTGTINGRANYSGSINGYLTSVKENNYFLNDYGNENGAIQKTAAQFASGEVAYLLNSGTTDGTQAWFQNIDNGEAVDMYPVFAGGTVYKVNRKDKTYSNNIYGENESVLNISDLRTYQRIVLDNGTLSEKSQIAYGYGTIDHTNRVVTVYMADTAERMGILMHQGVDGKTGIMELKGDYTNYFASKETRYMTSAYILSHNLDEPAIYTDGNGCIFITLPDDGTAIPELTVSYTQKPVEDYESTLYTLKVEIVDSNIFTQIDGTITDTLSKDDPDYAVVHGSEEPATVPSPSEDAGSSTYDETLKNPVKTDNGAVQTGNPVSAVMLLGALLAGFVVLFVHRRKFNN